MYLVCSHSTLTVILALLAGCVDICVTHEEEEVQKEVPRLLLISFDGFRWDYLDVVKKRGISTPTFQQLITDGVSIRSPGLTNAFATKTIPDHYTLVTGLYEEDHGVVANDFYDPVFNETFNIHNPAVATDTKWWNGTGSRKVSPVWMSNEHANPEHRASGVYMWPGSDVKGQQPSFFKAFNQSVPFQERADELVRWFTDAKHPINFGALYMPEPDATGHAYGPLSEEISKKIAELDDSMKYLLKKLEEAKLLHQLNIIFTSDHGMDDVNKVIYLNDHINSSLYESHGGTPVKHIWPKAGFEGTVYSQLQTLGNVSVYKKEEIPEEFHYKNNRRIAPIVLVADKGVQLCDNRDCKLLKGDHGYDNKMASMHPIFIAWGPAFKKNYVSEPFDTVNIYPLLCHLLDIRPRPNNGSLDNVKHILKDDGSLDMTLITFMFSTGFAALISAVWCIGACRSQRYNRRARVDGYRKPLQLSSFPGSRSEGNEPLLEDEDEDVA